MRSTVTTLALSGKFSGARLGQLRRAIEGARRTRREVVIDLSEVTLVDRLSLRFLAAQPDIKLVNCPEYIRSWLGREGTGRQLS
jgi:anti-anti-sigma regulatory factor